MSDPRFDVYIANAMFGEADRAFNAGLAVRLRETGLTVFLPQETAQNDSAAPTAQDIFVSDTRAVLASRLLLAVLDQETIDCGVACEVGLAFAAGIPVIGLLTDFRQFREGPGRIYKNLYVVGAIERNGQVCHSLEEAVGTCSAYLAETQPARLDRRVQEVYERARSTFMATLEDLATWYEPSFDPDAEIIGCLADCTPQRVLEVGCGPGRLLDAFSARWPSVEYVGVDPAWHGVSPRVAHPDLSLVPERSFDTAILAFVLHDIWDRDRFIAQLLDRMTKGGRIVVLDLSQDDLPRLVEALQSCLRLGPAARDPRLGLAQMSSLAARHDLALDQCQVIHRCFTFRDRRSFVAYAETFGLPVGLDLPVLSYAAWSRLISADDLADVITFPHLDDRWFLKCQLTLR